MASNGPGPTTPAETEQSSPSKKRKVSEILWEGKEMPTILRGAKEHNAKLQRNAPPAQAFPIASPPKGTKAPTETPATDVKRPVVSLHCEEALNDALETVTGQLNDTAAEKSHIDGESPANICLSPYSKLIISAQRRGVGVSLDYREDYKDQYTIEELKQRIGACEEANKRWKKLGKK